jgi:hypothetical protein
MTSSTCVFCGRRRKLTRDHIPPKCLWLRGTRPSNLITVPACKSCNLGTSGDDEYLRLVLVANREAAVHHAAKNLWPSVIRSLNRPVARAFFETVHEVELVSQGGLILGKTSAAMVDRDRLQRVLAKIIRGLFWHEYRRRLPGSHIVLSCCVNLMKQRIQKPELAEWVTRVRSLLVGCEERFLAPGVLVYRCQIDPHGSLRSVWGLTFFGRIHFAAFTGPRGCFDENRQLKP